MNKLTGDKTQSQRGTFSEVVSKLNNPVSILLISLIFVSPLVMILLLSQETEFGFLITFILIILTILLSIFVIYQGHRQKYRSKLRFLFIINGFYSLLLGMLLIFSHMGDPANFEDINYELYASLFNIHLSFFFFSLAYLILTSIASIFFIFTDKDHGWLFYLTMTLTTIHVLSVTALFLAFSMAIGYDLLCTAFYLIPIVLDIFIVISLIKNRHKNPKRLIDAEIK